MDLTMLLNRASSAGMADLAGPATVVLKATVVLLFAGMLAYAFRHRSAALRHLVWTLGIAGALTLPLASIALPFELDVLPARVVNVRAPVLSPPTEADNATKEGTAYVDNASGSADVASPVTAASPARKIPLGTAALVVWASVAVMLMLRFALGTATAAWLSRTSPELLDRDWNIALAKLAERTGVQRPVRMLRTTWTEMPLTWGVVQPVILIPESALSWSAERRDVVLLHELAHIHRNDTVTLALGQVVSALYWFNPLVWVAARRLRAEAERACDDWVLAAGMRASAYADHLLAMVQTVGRARLPAAVAMPMAQRSGFEGRLLAILEPGVKRGRMQKAQALAVSGAVTAVVIVLAALTPARPQAQQVAELDSIEHAGDASRSDDVTPPTPSREAGADVDVDVPGEAIIEDTQSGSGSSMSAAVIAGLTAALDDTDSSVRMAAILSLSEVQDPRAIAALIEALKSDKDAEVRKTSAWALGNIGSNTAVAALSDAVRSDASMDVRTTAAWALGSIGHQGGVDALAASVKAAHAPLREQAVWGLGNIESEQGVPALMSVLDDSDPKVRSQAVWALGQIESRSAVAPLTRALRSESDERVKEQIVWALGQIGDESAVEALSTSLRDASVMVRRQSAWALGQIEPNTAPAALRTAINDADASVRRQVVWALGQIEDESSAAALRSVLKDSDAQVRRGALRTLARFGDASAQEALLEMLKSEDPEMRKEAARMLSGNGGFNNVNPQPQPRPQPRPRSGG